MSDPVVRTTSPFRLEGVVKTPLPGVCNRWLEALIEKASGLNTLDRLYRELPASSGQLEFLQRVLDTFNIRYKVNDQQQAAVPATGATVLVANHPFGGLDGVLLAHHLLQQRTDIKFMANYILGRIPELEELFVSVDPFGGADARIANMRPLREALRWLKSGGVLVIFPAGEVSHLHASKRQVTDPEWDPSIARLVRAAQTPVIPVCFEGANSVGFQLAGLMHARLRTMLLPRELLNKEHRTFELTIGKPIAPKRLASFASDVELMRFLRLQTYSLYRGSVWRATADNVNTLVQQPIAPAVDAGLVAADIAALPQQQLLVDSGGFCVCYAHAGQIPHALREIGRLREITFRATGEGTGNPCDTDLFDDHYLHLILWDKEKGTVAGGYRLGLADEIVRKYGKQGLYTQQLFRYRSRLLHSMGPALELGRSFICADYQRSYSPLLLLWKGIGAFVSRHPRYRVLFGPVSISSDYQTSSRQLLVDFLKANLFDVQLSRLVRPKKPFKRLARMRWTASDVGSIGDLDKLSELITQIEADDKGVPVLLKQYLKLGGRLLGFNVDPDFNNALDGLIMVDLRNTDIKTLQKYMGKHEAQHFLEFHRALLPGWRKVS
jgi:putative hemolysin